LPSQICAQGGATYVWTASPPDPSLNGQANNACANVTPLSTTSYLVTGTDANGCQNTAITTVVVIPIYPEVDFYGEPLSGCEPLRVQFYDNSMKVMPGATYFWDFGNGTYSYDVNPLANFNHAGTFSVTLTIENPGGMAASLQITDYVVVYPNPVAMFGTAPENSTTILDPIFRFYDYSLFNPNQWYWTFGDGFFDTQQNPIHNYSTDNYYYDFPMMDDTGSYMVTLHVTTDHGCTDSTSKLVRIEPTYDLYIPNAFSPNNDEKNQKFCVLGYGVRNENYSIVIFDRWGQVVFSSTNREECWDGKVRNAGSNIATYVYRIHFEDTQTIEHELKGIVTIVK
jgi:gliding motility-associated-like protein